MWRKDGEAYSIKNTVPPVKFGDGSIMILGCFSMKSVGRISLIDGKMNVRKYIQILQENMMSSVECLVPPADYIFEKDKDTKRTAKSM